MLAVLAVRGELHLEPLLRGGDHDPDGGDGVPACLRQGDVCESQRAPSFR